MELIIGERPLSKINKEKSIIVAPWVINKDDDIIFDRIQYNIIPSPFSTTYQIKEAEAICINYAINLLPSLSNYYNNKNGFDYTTKFWKVILFPWLLYFVQGCYFRQKKIKNLLNEYPNYIFKVSLLKDNINWRFKNCSDFVENGLKNSIYNEWLYSRIVESFKADDWDVNYIDKSNKYKKNNLNYEKPSIKLAIKKALPIKYLNGFGNVYGINGFSLFDYISFNLHLNFGRQSDKLSKIENSNLSADPPPNIEWSINFERLLFKSAPIFFEEIHRHGVKYRKTRSPINLVSAAPITHNDNIEKIRLAVKYENGDLIIPVQHGGHNYGTSELNSIPSQVEYNHKAYFSWGWKAQAGYHGNFIALPSPYLSKERNSYNNKNSKIIFVGNYMCKYFTSFNGYPGGVDIFNYREMKIAFLKHINGKAIQNIYYKPYFQPASSISDSSYIQYYFPKLKIFKGDLLSEIKKCRLLVLDHPGTTLHLAMSANIPTIMLWDKKHFAMTQEFVGIMNIFKDLGVYHNNPVSAAEILNNIYYNVDEFWNNSKIQMARRLMVRKYGLNSKNWKYLWLKAIQNL